MQQKVFFCKPTSLASYKSPIPCLKIARWHCLCKKENMPSLMDFLSFNQNSIWQFEQVRKKILIVFFQEFFLSTKTSNNRFRGLTVDFFFLLSDKLVLVRRREIESKLLKISGMNELKNLDYLLQKHRANVNGTNVGGEEEEERITEQTLLVPQQQQHQQPILLHLEEYLMKKEERSFKRVIPVNSILYLCLHESRFVTLMGIVTFTTLMMYTYTHTHNYYLCHVIKTRISEVCICFKTKSGETEREWCVSLCKNYPLTPCCPCLTHTHTS